MPIDSNIVDPRTGQSAVVTKYGAVLVSDTITELSALGIKNRFTYFNALVGSTGAVATGLTNANMNQDGSVTAQEFYIAAELETDIRIMEISIILADSAVNHSNFGNVAALANGFDLSVSERGIITPVISAAKTGGQLIAQSGLGGAYGNGATSFELTNWDSTNDATTVAIDIKSIIPGGIRLGRGTDDKIFATVRDNLTGLTEFTVRILGHRHHE